MSQSRPERSASPKQRHVTAVLVTYNREQLLQQALDALAAQTRTPNRVIIVDNASTDASGQVADSHPIGADVLHLARNVGGAGGFTAGMAHALTTGSTDWLWVMDDDTIPEPAALAELLAAEDRLTAAGIRADVLSSQAVWTDGRPHPMNSSRTRIGTSAEELSRYERLGVRPIRTASFVSAFLRADAVRRHGLPIADYFIWSDDFEHTGRLLKHGAGFHVPASRVEHRTAQFSSAKTNPGARMRYDVRNRIWALARTDSFTWRERALYGGASVLGWLRTIARTRGEVLPVAWRGFLEGVRERPRAAEVVLGADPARAGDVRELNEQHAR